MKHILRIYDTAYSKIMSRLYIVYNNKFLNFCLYKML